MSGTAIRWDESPTLGALPALAARRWGEREALYFEGRRWSFADFDRLVDAVAKGLIAIGVAHGEHVALWMTNRPENLALLYAIPKIGAVIVPLNTRYRTDDIAYTVNQSDSATLVAMDRSGPVDYLAMLREVMPHCRAELPDGLKLSGFPKLERIVMIGRDILAGAQRWDDMIAQGAVVEDATLRARADAVDPADMFAILYTSGTTGHPKGVMHSHVCIRNICERARILGYTAKDVQMCYVPLFHLYGVSELAYMSMITGGKLVLMESFDAAAALRLVAQEGGTVIHGFDTHYADLLAAQEAAPQNLSSLRMGTLPSGMDSSVPVARRAQRELCPTVSCWGMTECWALVLLSPPSASEEQRVHASGEPMPGLEFRVVDPESGADRPVSVPGELLCRGYTTMLGYYKKPEATAEVVDAEGWIHTGDMALLREDGHIRFVGRYKDILKVGGENMSPAEVEAYLSDRFDVAMIAVVAYPDERLVEVPVAFIVRREGAELEEDDVINACRGRLASYKVPRRVLFVDDLPITASGKVQKAKLREHALEILGDPRGKAAVPVVPGCVSP